MSHQPLADVRPSSYTPLDEEYRGDGIVLDSIREAPKSDVRVLSSPSKVSRWRYLALGVALTVIAAIVVTVVVLKTRGVSDSDSSSRNRIQGGGQRAADADWTPVYTTADPTNVYKLAIQPRLQWNENYGYCGSTSMICAGMYFGEYISQYDNRNIASNGTNQKSESSQLLLGVNDYWAAHQHKMTNLLWDYSDTNVKNFFTWIKSQVLQNHPVIIGIFENESVFGNDPPDDDYDHIVIVTGWGSNHDLTDLGYYADDVIYFSDNGLYTPNGKDPVYTISAEIGVFAKSRKAADSKSAAVYSVNGSPTKDDPNFGIAITGLVDIHNDCLPTALTADKNYESPEIVDGSNTRPAAMAMKLTVTVSSLTVGQEYIIYQYNNMDDVPSSEFNANSGNAQATFPFTATDVTYKVDVDIKSSDLAIFRTVLKSAP